MDTNHRDQLFSLFYHQVVDDPYKPYLTYNEETLNYGETHAWIGNVVGLIKQYALKHNAVVLNFKDQQKLLISFWACTALEIDIILVPEIAINLEELLVSDYKLEADLMLTDFVEGKACCDIEMNTKPSSSGSIVPGVITRPKANIFFFTSGTTGKSKFIKTSYYQMTRAIKCIQEHQLMPYTVLQKVLLTVPLFHSYGLSAAIEYTQGGSHLFIPKSKDHISPLQALLSKFVGEQITAIEGVPYFYKQMAVMMSRLKLPCLKHIGMGGDSVSLELLKKMNDYNHSLSYSVRYGVTEIPSVISLNLFHYHDDISIRVLGKVLPIYQVALHSEDGALNETEGEMVVDFLLYPDLPGRISTGDLVELHNGSYIFKSRKIFLKYKGYKINPLEVEEYLNTHECVDDSRVYLNNDILTADLVVSQERMPDPKEIRNYLLSRVNAYLVPDQYNIVESIKRTKTGKVIR